MTARRPRPRASRLGRRSAPSTSTRRDTRAAALCEGQARPRRESSRRFCLPRRQRPWPARARNGSIWSDSRARNSGAATATRASTCRSMPGRAISKELRSDPAERRARSGRRASSDRARERRPDLQRSVGSRGLCDGRGAARGEAVPLERVDGGARARDRRGFPSGDRDPDDSYYLRWLAALERIVVDKGAASRSALELRKAAWARAAEATPHGQPILLANDPQSELSP